MPVFRWGQNWDPFRDLEREVDRLLQGMNLSFQRSARRFPLINLTDASDKFILTAEIPGVELADLELTAANGVFRGHGSVVCNCRIELTKTA